MKHLYVLRHAKSSWAEPGLGDIDRPLNGRGNRQLVLLSNWLGGRDHLPGKVICSPSLRTRQTYDGITAAAGNPPAEILDSLYLGSLEDYLSAIWAQDTPSLMLIGHNPTCDELARYLTAPSSPSAASLMAHHFSTGTVACFTFAGDSWSDLGRASCTLTDLVRPKELEA